ncbi:MAG: hypothetical protein FWF86_01730 [Clostridia bacterium]|nr:hypothetical protein [Clostridia bacterium]
MQRVRPRRRRARAIFTLLGILLLLCAVIYGVTTLLAPTPESIITANKLPCPYNDFIKPFGPNVLYYDGASIHCMSDRGSVRWSFQIGSNAGYDCDDRAIVAWAGNTVYILNQNGNSTYNDNLGDVIQFARIGRQYVAAIIGETTNPRLVVKDLSGAHMDEEADAYRDLILLDVGFYGKNGEYMWTLALDVFGTAANTILNTFEVGKMNTGEVSLGDNIVYSILYENGKLRVISTRKMYSFNYRGTEDVSQSVLVYGWKLIGYEPSVRGDIRMLFAPTTQTDNQFDIRELRLINGQNDKRYSLPDTCLGATIWNSTLYAVSKTQLFRAGPNASRFITYSLPLDKPVTRFIGTLNSGNVLLVCGEDVYAVTLPSS